MTQKDGRNQPVFVAQDGKTINFKETITPYWSQVCSEVMMMGGSASEHKGNAASSEANQPSKTLQTIFEKFKEKAEKQVLQAPASDAQPDSGKSELNWLTGGL